MKRAGLAGCKTLFSGSVADPGALQWVNLTEIPQLPRYLPRWAHSPALYVSSPHARTHSTEVPHTLHTCNWAIRDVVELQILQVKDSLMQENVLRSMQ